MVEQSIAPVQSISFVVHGKTIRPAQCCIPEDCHIGSVHVGSADVGRSVPLTEEHVASVRMNNNSSGSLEILEQCSPVVVVLCGQNIECSLPRVNVVEVVAGPVHGETFHSFILTCENILSTSSVFLNLDTEKS